MKIVVLGAGIIGVATAWYLLDDGHEVTVVDRQPEAALETSFANGAQISVSFCEPWASAGTPLKVAKWMLRDDAPLLFRPSLDWHQWRWALSFLGQCNDVAFERNVAQLVALGRYSHASLKALVARTGIRYDRLECGILHVFGTQADLDGNAKAAQLMQRFGVDRRVLTRDEVFRTEPALAHGTASIVGGIYTASDESGDAREFTQQLARQCQARGAEFVYEQEVQGFEREHRGSGDHITGVHLRRRYTGQAMRLGGDHVVAALGSYTAPLLRPLGIRLNILPTKGYSATLALKHPERASTVSMIDDAHKIAVSRLGDRIRVAGTAEMAGYDTSLDNATARVRCQALLTRYEELFPGVADLREPHFWAGLRPSTPDNIPYIGRSHIANLWINAGHGTLGWTHGAGSGRALAALISGQPPEIGFGFLGQPA